MKYLEPSQDFLFALLLDYADEHETIDESSRTDHQRTYGTESDEDDDHSKISRKAKAVYGGANDLKRSHPAKNGSGSSLIRTNSFLSVLRHIAVGLPVICALRF